MSDLKTRLAALSPERREKLLTIMRGAAPDVAPTTYPMCDMQRVMWAAQGLDPKSSAYNIGFIFELSAPYRVDLLREAVAAVVARHPGLRTVYGVDDTGPVQTVLAVGSVPIEDVDASALDAPALEQLIRAAYRRPFDLQRGPAWRLTQLRRSEGGALLLISAHHIAIDLWSIIILIGDLRIAYEAVRTGQPVQLAATTGDYSQFVRERRAWLNGTEQQRVWSFWRQQLRAAPPPIDLPTDHPRPALQSLRGDSYEFILSEALTAALTRLARREGSTLNAALLAIWSLVLHKYTGASDFVVGTPVSNRSIAFARTIGCTINYLPLRVRVHKDTQFSQLVEQVFHTVLHALDHQEFPFGTLTSRLSLPACSNRPRLAQVGFCLQGFQLQGHAEHNWQPRATPVPFLAQQEGQLELHLEMTECQGVLHGALRYRSELFERASAVRLAEAFTALATQACEAPAQKIGSFTAAELEAAASTLRQQNPPLSGEQPAPHAAAIRALWKQRCANRHVNVPQPINTNLQGASLQELRSE